MNNLGPHANFIVVAYSVVLSVVIALIAWITTEYRRQVKALRQFEMDGIRRRSSSPGANDKS